MQYINVNMDLFQIKELSYLDIMIYSHVCNYYFAKPRIQFTKSKTTLAQDFNTTKRTIYRCLAHLKELGMIRTKEIKKDVFLIRPLALKDTLIYKSRYIDKDNPGTNPNESNETEKIINELRQKWHRRG